MSAAESPSPSLTPSLSDLEEKAANAKYQLRSLHFLRVSRDAIIPLRLFLASPHTFNELMMSEIMAMLKEALPKHIRFEVSGEVRVISELKPSNPAHYVKPHLQFYWYFQQSRTDMHLVLPTEEGEQRFAKAAAEKPDTLAIATPGDLKNFKMCEQMLSVIVIPHNNKDKLTDAFDVDFWQGAGVELHHISKFFSTAK